MTTTITPAQLEALGISPQWLEPLNAAMLRFDINTPQRIAAFVGQCAHESANFAALSENLNYAAAALVKIWPRHFPSPEVAEAYHRQPEKIANRAYANRMGNGPEVSGEGWKFRGRGLIQLTGKDNYRVASDALGVDLVANPDSVTQPDMAALTAAWFWHKNKLNDPADRGDTVAISKRINGGTHGLDDRLQRTSTALALLTLPGGQAPDTMTA